MSLTQNLVRTSPYVRIRSPGPELMTRQIVEAAFEVLAKFDAIEALKLVLEVEIPNMTLILNTIGQDSLKVDEVCKIKYTLE